MDELISAGTEGFMISIDKFDTNKGAKFTSYCWFWIRKYIGATYSNIAKPISNSTWTKSLIRFDTKGDYDLDQLQVEDFGDFAFDNTISAKTIIKEEYYDEAILSILNSIEQLKEKEKDALYYNFGASEEYKKNLDDKYNWNNRIIAVHKNKSLKAIRDNIKLDWIVDNR